MSNNRINVFWIFTIGVLVLLILPLALQDGMFMDGMLYASVSKNLANGHGSFWFPHFSTTLYPFFNQQPPLGFGIQSIFFKLFGDGLYIERMYGLGCALISCLCIHTIWKLISSSHEMKQISWFPALLWITIPVCFWAHSNNMLENTMSIFDLSAVIFILNYILKSQKTIYLILAGVLLVCAVLTKGIQGAFPLASLILAYIILKPFSWYKSILASLVLVGAFGGIFGLLLLSADARMGLQAYFNDRVLNSITNVSEVNNRFFLLGELFFQLIPALLLTIVIRTFYFARKQKLDAKTKKYAIYFLLIGVSASFPLIVTLEQRDFYLVTSLPYFAICLALVLEKPVRDFMSKINQFRRIKKTLLPVSITLFCGAIAFSLTKIGNISRDQEVIHDVNLIGEKVPGNSTIGGSRNLWHIWSVQEYLVRKFYICTDDTISNTQKYFILGSNEQIPAGIQAYKINIPTLQYHLYTTEKPTTTESYRP